MFNFVHHVYYVVHDRDALVEYSEHNFGMKSDKLVVYEDRGIKDALYDVGQSHMQITEPLNPESNIAEHLAEPNTAQGCIPSPGGLTISARCRKSWPQRVTRCRAETVSPKARAAI